MVDPDVILGTGVIIFDEKMVNLFGCSIGDKSFIGPFVEITRGVEIGMNCKIESHTFICDSVKIEDDVFVGHGVMFTNDLYPRTDRHVDYIKTFIKRGASIGSNATIIAGVTIGEYSVVGAGSVVTKDIADFTIVCGNPARVTRSFDNSTQLKAYTERRQSTQKGPT